MSAVEQWGTTVVPQRVLDRVVKRVPQGNLDECWLWPGAVGHGGYGVISWLDQDTGRQRQAKVHRAAWAAANGPIPIGLTIDHICRVRLCCNPAHLRLLTNFENAQDNGFSSKTHCKRGHELAGDNITLRTTPKGNTIRICRLCAVQRWWESREANLAKQQAKRRARGVQPGNHNGRKTHCPQGHEYTPENTYDWSDATRTRRACRACKIEREARRRAAQRDAA